jgi:cell division protein ZapE
VASLVPPPRFDDARFSTYLPDPAQPSQRAAVEVLERFATTTQPQPKRCSAGASRRPVGPASTSTAGSGVGKTHLLAALWHDSAEPRAYGTFVELTHLVGALGFGATVEALSGTPAARHRRVSSWTTRRQRCSSRHCCSAWSRRCAGGRDVEHACRTRWAKGASRPGLPAEIQGLAPTSAPCGSTVRTTATAACRRPPPRRPAQVARRRGARPGAPATTSRAAGAPVVAAPVALRRARRRRPPRRLTGVRPVDDQSAALRLVVLADRLRPDVPVSASGVPLDRLFPTSCSPAATARSTCGRSAASRPSPARRRPADLRITLAGSLRYAGTSC